jgi:hypothetical protein
MAIEEPKITDWLGIALGLAALSQPWIIAGWNKVFSTPKIKVYPHRIFELGFSNYGPTVGFRGAIRCENREAFISSIVIDVVRRKDGRRVRFDWLGKKEERALVSTAKSGQMQEEAAVTVPTGFVVGPMSVPFSYFLVDLSLAPQIRPLIEGLRSDWGKHVDSVRSTKSPEGHDWIAELRAFAAKSQEFGRFITFLENEFFWQMGGFDAEITANVESFESKKVKFSFDLDFDESEKLKANRFEVIREVCLSKASYHFSFLDISDFK